jgi:hypothetical protein
VDVNELIERYPRLFHLAEAGSAPAIGRASMVSAHHRRIRLSAINSGSTLYPNAPERGTRTFQTIEGYPFAERIRGRTPQAAVVELAVSGEVRDLSSHVIDVYRRVA